MLKRVLILVPFVLLVAVVGTGADCSLLQFTYRTDFLLKNACQFPFHPDGEARLDLGESREYSVHHASIRETDIQRPSGTTLATLTLTSFYDEDEPTHRGVTVTLSEYPVGKFAAISTDSMIHVLVTHP